MSRGRSGGGAFLATYPEPFFESNVCINISKKYCLRLSGKYADFQRYLGFPTMPAKSQVIYVMYEFAEVRKGKRKFAK